MATLALEHVGKVFDNGTEAVKDLSLSIEPGEFVILVGPSGCGKTTVLRMVAGLEDATTGEIRFDGRLANDMAPGERDVAMVFQNYALYPHLNVHDNIAFSLAVRKVPKAVRRQRVKEAARLLGLSELLDAKPRELSGGQRQRVAMGRALVREPAVFLMDEPLSNLDASLRAEMRTEVMHLQKRLGVATMYVTHDQTEAMTMGDRVAVMRGGVLQQFAPPQELYDHPGNVFVASFMGAPAMNLFVAHVAESTADGATIALGSQRLQLAAGAVGGQNPPTDREVILGIRPEELVPGASADAGGCTLTADVDLVEALGNEQLVHFAIDASNHREGTSAADEDGDSDPAAAANLSQTAAGKGVARVDPRLPVAPGQSITFTLDPSRLHFFDAATGEALAGSASPRPLAGQPK